MIPLQLAEDEAFVFAPDAEIHIPKNAPVKWDGKRIGTVKSAKATPHGIEVEMEIDDAGSGTEAPSGEGA